MVKWVKSVWLLSACLGLILFGSLCFMFVRMLQHGEMCYKKYVLIFFVVCRCFFLFYGLCLVVSYWYRFGDRYWYWFAWV